MTPLSLRCRGIALALVLALGAPSQADRTAGHSFDHGRLGRVASLLRAEVDQGHYAGASFLVMQNDVVAASGTFGVADLESGRVLQRDTIFRIYSMSKLITALATLQLFERNLFQLDTDVATFLPELRELRVFHGGTADAPETVPAAGPITVRMLLNHTAGFTYGFFQDSPVQELYRRADLWNASSLDEFLGRVAELPLLAQPGTAWNYSISDDVLGVLVQRASGQPFAEYVRDHLTGPLGMTDTGFDVPADRRHRLATLCTWADGALRATEPILGSTAEPGKGFPSGGGGMFSTLDDYARLLRAVLGTGELDGVRILGRKTLELGALNTLGTDQGGPGPGDGWGLFSAVRFDCAASAQLGSRGMLFWSGAATTHFFVDPQERLVALLFCQHLPYDQHRLIPRFRTAVYQALR